MKLSEPDCEALRQFLRNLAASDIVKIMTVVDRHGNKRLDPSTVQVVTMIEGLRHGLFPSATPRPPNAGDMTSHPNLRVRSDSGDHKTRPASMSHPSIKTG